jgi:hypothetical protein
MQCACAILSSVAFPALKYYSPLSYKRHDYQKKKLLSIQRVFWFSLQLLSETFLILRRNERDVINVYWSVCKVPVILVRFFLNRNFHDRLSKDTQIINFTKIRPVGAELFHADGRTDMMKVTVAFRNFAKASKVPVGTWQTVSFCVGWESNLCLISRNQSLSSCSRPGIKNHCLFQVKKFRVHSSRLCCTKYVVSSSFWKGMLWVPTDTVGLVIQLSIQKALLLREPLSLSAHSHAAVQLWCL